MNGGMCARRTVGIYKVTIELSTAEIRRLAIGIEDDMSLEACLIRTKLKLLSEEAWVREEVWRNERLLFGRRLDTGGL